MNKKLLILGAGQYGMVAKEIAESMRCFDRIEFLDDNNAIAIGKLADYESFAGEYTYAFVAMGDPELRISWIEKLEMSCFRIPILVSPMAYVSPSAQLMKGTIVEPMAVVQANSTVAIGCLVCSGVIVKHNAFIGDGCYLDCNSVVMPNSIVFARTKIEATVYSSPHDK